MEMNRDPHLEPKEGVVLDADGNTLHDPMFGSEPHVRATWATKTKNVGIVPKILLGGVLALLLVAGLAISAVVLGVIVIAYILKSIFGARR